MDEYLSTKETRKILNVTTATLINWDNSGKIRTIKSPSGKRLYSKKDICSIVGNDKIIPEKEKVCYCRVSSKKQIDDLGRQREFLESRYPNHTIITDVGSGINWKRKGLRTILERSMSGEIKEVVVAHSDRLCRFAFELIEWILKRNNVELIILDKDDCKSKDTELSDDILSIIHVYSCRNMGRRR